MTNSPFDVKMAPRNIATFCIVILFCFSVKSSNAQQPYLGDIRMFAGNFAPRGWLICDGRILPIFSNPALFSLLGTQYGGDGELTFGLPDLRDRFALGSATNSNLNQIGNLGEVSGQSSFTIFLNNLPFHQHLLLVYRGPGNTDSPNGTILAVGQTPDLTTVAMPYSTNPPNATLSPRTLGVIGNSTPVAINPPYLGINYIIAIDGIFPSRQ